MSRKIPTRIVRMIGTRQAKGQTAKQIAKSVNSTPTARNLGVKLSDRSIAAIMANFTMGNYSHL